MFTGDDLLAELINRFARLHGLYQLLARVRILTGYQPFILFAAHFTFEFPLVGETTSPASFNFSGLAVVVVFRVRELLLVIVQRLPCRNRSAHCHHGPQPQNRVSSESASWGAISSSSTCSCSSALAGAGAGSGCRGSPTGRGCRSTKAAARFGRLM